MGVPGVPGVVGAYMYKATIVFRLAEGTQPLSISISVGEVAIQLVPVVEA